MCAVVLGCYIECITPVITRYFMYTMYCVFFRGILCDVVESHDLMFISFKFLIVSE